MLKVFWNIFRSLKLVSRGLDAENTTDAIGNGLHYFLLVSGCIPYARAILTILTPMYCETYIQVKETRMLYQLNWFK